MITTPRRPTPILLLAAAVALGACGTSSSTATFACGPTSLQCTSGAQYCLHITTTPAAYTCVNLPAGCTASFCSCITPTVPHQTSCAAVSIGGTSQIEVTATSM